eukprot:8836460-Pyramimonas_sp.AAC.1
MEPSSRRYRGQLDRAARGILGRRPARVLCAQGCAVPCPARRGGQGDAAGVGHSPPRPPDLLRRDQPGAAHGAGSA